MHHVNYLIFGYVFPNAMDKANIGRGLLQQPGHQIEKDTYQPSYR